MTRSAAMTLLRRAIVVFVVVLAIEAVLAGLERIGFRVRVAPTVSTMHGPLFVLGVFSSLIALERAIALNRGWAYTVPALSVLAGIALAVLGTISLPLTVVAAVGLVLLNAAIVRRQASPHTWLMLLGSLGLVASNLAWALGLGIPEVAPGWITFFVVTIVAERLELARLASPPRSAVRLLVALCILLVGASLTALIARERGIQFLGIALAAVGAWLWRYDLARRTVRLQGLPRYSASAVLVGASWLMVAGVLGALGFPPAGARYDAVLHSVFIGFVLSMVFAHAPIILPAVARLAIPFHAALYAPLTLLHLALLARVAGDLAGLPHCRLIGGFGNAAALASFPLAILLARRKTRDRFAAA